jgi:hypothetical protein
MRLLKQWEQATAVGQMHQAAEDVLAMAAMCRCHNYMPMLLCDFVVRRPAQVLAGPAALSVAYRK